MAGFVIYSLDTDKFQNLVTNPSPKQLRALADLVSDGLDEHDDEFDEDDPIRDWPSEGTKLDEIVKKRLARHDWYSDLSDTGKNLWEGAIWNYCINVKPKSVDFRVDNDGVYWDVMELTRKHYRIAENQYSPDVALSTFGTRPFRYHPRATPIKSRAEFDRDQKARDEMGDVVKLVLAEVMAELLTGKKDQSKVLQDIAKRMKLTEKQKKLLENLLNDEDGEDEGDELGDSEKWLPMHSMHMPEEVRQMIEELKGAEVTIQRSRNKEAIRDFDSLVETLEQIAKENRMVFIQVDT